MGMMIVRHKVRDYGQWRPVFDRHAEMQRAAGLSNPRVYHSADSNKSEIVVVFDTEDTKKAKDFAAKSRAWPRTPITHFTARHVLLMPRQKAVFPQSWGKYLPKRSADCR